jgi:hypothetical protein
MWMSIVVSDRPLPPEPFLRPPRAPLELSPARVSEPTSRKFSVPATASTGRDLQSFTQMDPMLWNCPLM